MPETVLSSGKSTVNETDKKSCIHGTYTIVGLRIRNLGSKAGCATSQLGLSFLKDKTRGLEEVLNLRHHPRGYLEIIREAFAIIITGGCY